MRNERLESHEIPRVFALFFDDSDHRNDVSIPLEMYLLSDMKKKWTRNGTNLLHRESKMHTKKITGGQTNESSRKDRELRLWE